MKKLQDHLTPNWWTQATRRARIFNAIASGVAGLGALGGLSYLIYRDSGSVAIFPTAGVVVLYMTTMLAVLVIKPESMPTFIRRTLVLGFALTIAVTVAFIAAMFIAD